MNKEILENYHIEPDVRTYRIVGINKYHMYVDNDIRGGRVNVWYHSNDFGDVLKRDKIDVKNPDAIRKCFLKEKESLKHLSWEVMGYY
jgi:hypothetical protein